MVADSLALRATVVLSEDKTYGESFNSLVAANHEVREHGPALRLVNC